jgi:hypothetical protein
MLMHKTSRKKKRRARESGQAAVFLVLAMGLFLIGSMGFVVDGTNLWFHRQSAQTAADAACTAGAMNMLSVAAGADTTDSNWIGTSFECSGSTSTGGGNVPNSGFAPCQYAAFNGYTSSGLQANKAGNDVSVTFPGSFASMPSCATGIPPSQLCTAEAIAATPYMQVNITDRVQTTFIGMLNGGHTVDVGAQAMCGLSNVLSPVPVLVLNPNLQKTMTANSNATLAVLNGPQKSIQVNSINTSAVHMPSGNIDLSGANGGEGGDFAVAARETRSDAGLPSTVNWVDPAGVISDPFASVPAPQQSALADCSGTNCIHYGDKTSNYGCPDLTDGCDIYSGGIYPSGITVQRGLNANGGQDSSVTGLAVFLPGTYYLGSNLFADSDSCLRPAYAVSHGATAAGDGSGGTMFYFSGNATLHITSNSGALKRPRTSGTKFNCATSAVPLSEAACAGSHLNLPPGITGFTGNVLLAPCTGPYGDPLGATDPASNQRGMLFFQDRDAQLANPPTWNDNGSFGLIGNVYFHYCNSTSSTGTGSGANCSPDAFTDVFNLGSGDDAYIVGNLVVDQLQLGQSNGNSPVTVSLNPNAQYHVLKASLLQ